MSTLLEQPITWNDGDDGIGDGQHRLCALRAAGVRQCPVEGVFLPDTDYGVPIDADEHARRTVARSRSTT